MDLDTRDFEDPLEVGLAVIRPELKHNSYRKYRIVYNYAKENFKSFSRINYKDVLVVFLLKYSLGEFITLLQSTELGNELKALELLDIDFQVEIEKLEEAASEFETLSKKYQSIALKDISDKAVLLELYQFYFKSDFLPFCNKIHSLLKSKSRLKRNKLLQVIANNLRRSGNPYNFSDASANKIFTIVEFINHVIKGYRKTPEGEERTQIVIDDLRNPIEIMYFKQRYASFYTVSINRDSAKRKEVLKEKYNGTPESLS